LFYFRCATTSDYDRDNKWGNCVAIKCYKIVDDLKTYSQAKASCVADNARLASITSDYEQGILNYVEFFY
jgi:hypothetical protein